MTNPSQSSRLQKLLGTAPPQILQDAIKPGPAGATNWNNWVMFWSQLRDKSKTTATMEAAGTSLLQKITESKSTAVAAEVTDALINLIAYMVCYYTKCTDVPSTFFLIHSLVGACVPNRRYSRQSKVMMLSCVRSSPHGKVKKVICAIGHKRWK